MYAPEKISTDNYEAFIETFEHIIHLINHNRLEQATAILTTLHYSELADFLDNANDKLHKRILPLLSDNIKPETMLWLSDSAKHSVIEVLGIEKSCALLDQLAIEDAIEVIETIDDQVKQLIVANFNNDKQQQIIEGFTYPENTVGRIVERNFISFQEYWTVGQAIDFIRQTHPQRDFHAAIVVDNRYRPVGNILLSTLLKYYRRTMIREIMNSEFKVANTLTPLTDIAFIFKKYALTIVPVVSKSGKLIGSVSVNNMIYIVDQQTEKEIMQLGGIHTRDTFLTIFHTARHRFPWLFINLITAFITSMIIGQFSATLKQLITLAVIMPIVASMGGNAGTQAMTVTVRALANKDINHTNIIKVILKETMVCGLNGFLFACISASASLAIFTDLYLSIIFGSAIFINFIIAGLFGAMIPITLEKLDIDPATASGVFLTTITDASGFFTFLTLAYILLA
ncbi:magnesium transporter [Candidatus Trichorickettsia mobilis]|uniref:magnesium transporter n=1 Tax=Candidatus Trichorickettsia mobilis TaxID=1346319 RepID=UPI00292D7199|nr:magnesium transporter [Candidatus Trichorickettsia mobilis]